MQVKNVIDDLFPSDIYEIGYADIKGLLVPEYSKYQYGISIIRRLDDSVIDKIIKGPTRQYYDYNNSINIELSEKAGLLEKILTDNNIDSIAVDSMINDENSDEYMKTLRCKISHKMIATRSGLGWIGKTDLFISKRFGARVRLAAVITAQSLLPEYLPIEESLCGDCSICVDACPAHAGNGILWNTKTDRDVFFDAFKCRIHCREISKRNLNENISLCGTCVSICPQGRK